MGHDEAERGRLVIYLALLPNPFMHPAANHSGAAVQAAGTTCPPGPAADLSYAEELAELERLIAINNASCSDDVPLFLRSA
ncbi:MAG: hypothetical protein JWP08_1913 [Bryobacterales bacterium]|nr:hypothetical protein [Bryobacterales bacterium]